MGMIYTLTTLSQAFLGKQEFTNVILGEKGRRMEGFIKLKMLVWGCNTTIPT